MEVFVLRNDTHFPLNVVSFHHLLAWPYDYEMRMQLLPEETYIKVCVWLWTDLESEISRNKIRTYIAAKGAISMVTFGLHDTIHTGAKAVGADIISQFIISRLSNIALDKASLSSSSKITIKGGITKKYGGIFR